MEALLPAEKPHLHLFIATSDIHLKHKLKMSREEALKAAVEWVSYARKRLGRDAEIEFSAEDASRTEHDFLLKVYEAVVDAGATTVNIPDTVGYAIPAEFGDLTTQGRRPRRLAVPSSASTATTTWAWPRPTRSRPCRPVRARWRSPSTASASAPATPRSRRWSWPCAPAPPSSRSAGHSINTEQISNASRLVSYLTGFTVQPNKAIVGRNAFAHESGIHQDGVLKNALTYEIMTPQSVGLSGSRLSVGKLSGRRGLQGKLAELGYDLEGEALDELYRAGHRPGRHQEGGHRRRPHRARRGAGLGRRPAEEQAAADSPVQLVDWSISTGKGGIAKGAVSLLVKGQAAEAHGRGQRPRGRALRGRRQGRRAARRLAPAAWPSTRSARSRAARTPRAR